MKKKLMAVLLVLVSVFFSGCSSAPDYTVYQNTDGSVVEIIGVPFSVTELRRLDVSEQTAIKIGDSIVNSFQNYYNANLNNYIVRVEKDYTDGVFTLQERNYLLSNDSVVTQKSGNYENILFQTVYKNALVYHYYKSGMQYKELIAELEKDNYEYKKSFFTYNRLTVSTNIFGAEVKDGTPLLTFLNHQITSILTEDYINLTQNQIADLVPKTYVYRYGTTSRRLHSDADRKYFNGELYLHEWDISAENPKREISTWTTHANGNVWYVGALIIGIAVIIVLSVRYKIKHKKSEDNQN